MARCAVAGRFVNGYSLTDWLLALCCRCALAIHVSAHVVYDGLMLSPRSESQPHDLLLPLASYSRYTVRQWSSRKHAGACLLSDRSLPNIIFFHLAIS
jgi:Protein of unknown function (DUF726)